MKLVAIYQCGEELVLSVEIKQKTGFLISTMTMLSISRAKSLNEIQETLNETLDLSNTKKLGEKYTSAKFNKNLAKLCKCSSYKEVVSKSSIVKVILNLEQVTLIPMKKAESYIGFEGYNNCSEVLPESSLTNGEAVERILELLDEVIESYIPLK